MCPYTYFDIILNTTKKIPEKHVKRAHFIKERCAFREFLDYCVARGCFSETDSHFLFVFTVRYSDLDGTYYEEDPYMLSRIYEAVGLTQA